MNPLKNRRGQSLVEYLILVSLMAVATIGVVRSLNHVVNTRFANVIYALRGEQKRARTDSFDENLTKTRDLSDFMNGAASGKEQQQ